MKITNLTVKYSKEVVLNKLNINLDNEKIHVFLGKSGVGKTSFINSILGLVEYEGTIENDLLNPSVVFQEDRLIEFKTIANNLKFVSKELEDEEIISNLNLLNLSGVENKYPRELSGGMKQRVNIARAISYDSSLIIMDEPFKSIDTKNKTDILNKLKKYFKDNKKTVLVVTHDIEAAIQIADLVHVIKKDEIISLENSGDNMKMKLFNTYE